MRLPLSSARKPLSGVRKPSVHRGAEALQSGPPTSRLHPPPLAPWASPAHPPSVCGTCLPPAPSSRSRPHRPSSPAPLLRWCAFQPSGLSVPSLLPHGLCMVASQRGLVLLRVDALPRWAHPACWLEALSCSDNAHTSAPARPACQTSSPCIPLPLTIAAWISTSLSVGPSQL